MQSSIDLLIGTGIGLFTAFLWGISTNIYKSQGDEARPLVISSLKSWVSGCFMALLVVMPFRTTPFYIPFESLVYLIASVTIGLVIGDLAFLIGLDRIGVSYAFPIANIYPITTYIVAIMLVGEEVLPIRFIGIMMAVAGVTVVSLEQSSIDENTQAKRDLIGIGLAFLAAICWSFGSVFLQIGVEGVNPIDANFVRMLVGSGIFIPLFLGARHRGMKMPSRGATKIVLVGGFLGMALGALLYTYTVSQIGASVAALLGSTAPLFALPISIIFLKERYTSRSIFGVMLTVIGVILVVVAF
ncbi:MAG: DMT family transporter [Candidatus Thorarchaeota archaeon]